MTNLETATLDACIDDSEIPMYEDDGCGVYTSCLSCPLPKCIEDVGVNEAIQLAWSQYIDLPGFRTQYTGQLKDIPPGLDRDEFIWARARFNRLTPPQREEIKRRLRAGETHRAIVFELPVLAKTVTRISKELQKEDRNYEPSRPGRRKNVPKAGLPEPNGSLQVVQGTT